MALRYIYSLHFADEETSSEMLNKVSKVTPAVSGRDKIPSQVCLATQPVLRTPLLSGMGFLGQCAPRWTWGGRGAEDTADAVESFAMFSHARDVAVQRRWLSIMDHFLVFCFHKGK